MAIFSDAAWRDMAAEMWYARGKVEDIYREIFGREVVITSGRREPTPSGSSKHGTGEAMDIRSIDLTEQDEKILADTIAKRLGEDFDVVIEGQFAPNPKYRDRPRHLHVEYDPKGRHL